MKLVYPLVLFLFVMGCTTITYHIGEKVKFNEPYVQFYNPCIGDITHGPLYSPRGTFWAVRETCEKSDKRDIIFINEKDMEKLD